MPEIGKAADVARTRITNLAGNNYRADIEKFHDRN